MPVGIKQIKTILWAIDLALGVAVVFFLTSAAGSLFAATPLMEPEPLVDSPRVSSVATRSKIRPYRQYSLLRKSDLFGALSTSNVAARTVVEETLPETKLELELLGCVSSELPEWSFAVIRNKKSRTEGTYSVGDFIVSDAQVEEIRETEVVISHRGRREVLVMAFDDEGPTSPFRPGPGRRSLPPRRSRSSPTSNKAINQVTNRLWEINRKKLMEEVKDNLGSLMSQVRTSPNIVDDKPSGIQIDAIGSDPILNESGLKPGDIVISVNGVRVNSLEDALASSDRLQNASEIRVVVKRDGRHTTLRYRIR